MGMINYMKAYLYYMKMRILTEFSYRFDVFASLGSNIIILLTTVYIWKSAYHNSAISVNGVTETDMITYTIISVILSIFFSNSIQDTLNNRIREGNIAIDFLRPIHLLISYFADEVGKSISSLLNKGIGIFIISSLVFHLPLPKSFLSFFLFSISCVLSFTILWLLSAICGVFAFWVVELGNMGMVKDALVLFLSGSFVPIWFYPKELQIVSKFLPFQYTFQTPLSIYIGKLPISDAWVSIMIQTIWVFIFAWILIRLWKKAQYKTFVQGG
jgi:ABC-2 type transport system permease protein